MSDAGRAPAALIAMACCALACARTAGDGAAGDVAGESQELPRALARIDSPPAPVRTPEASMATFRVAPGFRVELVAAEPLVEDPVAIAFDPAGRLWAVEMRGYMPDLQGRGDDAPVGRVVVLEDDDADGRMDRSTVFMDGLVLPRALALAGDGVLVAEPPRLWLCRDLDGDLRCDERREVATYGDPRSNMEHDANGLVQGLDGWLYSARWNQRLRLRAGEIESSPTPFRGQWGIAIDDVGRLLYNTNFTYLIADLFPAEYLLRHPATAPPVGPGDGLAQLLTPEPEIHTIRPNLGVTRGYRDGELRDDGRLAVPTAVSGLAIQRGDQYGAAFSGDAFLPEPAANCVVHMKLRSRGIDLTAEHRTYPDPERGRREFLCAGDERFRPVNAALAPDGTIHVVDMYRGLVQHAEFVTSYLSEYVKRMGLEQPLGLGRIYRIVREDRPVRREPPALDRAGPLELVAALSEPNGWTRDTAQRLLVEQGGAGALDALRDLANHTPRGRLHALWALRQLDAVDVELVRAALRDDDPRVRATGIRVGEALAAGPAADGWLDGVIAALDDGRPDVRLQAVFSLGEAAGSPRAREALLGALDRRGGEPHVLQAVLSGLGGEDLAALGELLERPDWTVETAGRSRALAALAAGVLDRLRDPGEGTARQGRPGGLLDRIAAQPDGWQREALLEGLVRVARSPGFSPVELDAPHPLLVGAAAAGGSLGRAKSAFTWPGDPDRPGAIQLDAEQRARLERGGPLYTELCAGCHLPHGRGQAGLAPSLVGSPWVLDSDGWLVRIVLHGIAGPMLLDGRRWDAVMPGHGANPALDDEALAALLTWIRRAWGNDGRPIDPPRAAEIRARAAGRPVPWTVDELRVLDVDHVHDAYVGRYRMRGMPVSLRVVREGSALHMSAPMMGSSRLEPGDDGWWRAEGRSEAFRFRTNGAGQVTDLELRRGGPGAEPMRFTRVE